MNPTPENLKPSIAEMKLWRKESMPGNAEWSASTFAKLAYQAGYRAALQSQQSAAPTREVVFGGPEVRARMLEAGLPTADDHAKLAAGRGGVSPPHQAAADPDLTSLWLLINAWQEAKPPAFELVGKINGEVLRLVAAPPATPSAQPDWTAAARLIDASYQATKLKLLTGTSNWAAFICKMMAAPVPETGHSVSKTGDSDTQSGLSVTDSEQSATEQGKS
ncbi:MAG: hypothetical protein WAW73_20120 [Rhodoferax sp.]